MEDKKERHDNIDNKVEDENKDINSLEGGASASEGNEGVINSAEVQADTQTQTKEEEKEKVKQIKEFILSLKKQVEEKENKIKEYEDLIKRIAADFDNYKKKVNKEKIEYTRFANKDLILDILPIMDNFDRAISAIENANIPDNIKDLFIGIKLIHKELMNVLMKYGVVSLDVEGKIFDPNISEVIEVEEVEVEEEDKDIVIKEYLKAYKMYDQVIRPAKVKVQKRRKKKEAEGENKSSPEDAGDGGVSSSSS